jgi:hypothetical protein
MVKDLKKEKRMGIPGSVNVVASGKRATFRIRPWADFHV